MCCKRRIFLWTFKVTKVMFRAWFRSQLGRHPITFRSSKLHILSPRAVRGYQALKLRVLECHDQWTTMFSPSSNVLWDLWGDRIANGHMSTFFNEQPNFPKNLNYFYPKLSLEFAKEFQSHIFVMGPCDLLYFCLVTDYS